MLPQCLLLVASAFSLASAGPVHVRSPPLPLIPVGKNAFPTLPTTEGGTLPAPSGKLVHIGAGHGLQNYTCAAAGGTPTLVGALAVLYDVTALYPGSGPGALGEAAWTGLASRLLRETALPLDPSRAGAPFAADGRDAPVTVGGVTLPVLGRHYFDAAGTPTFDLYAAGQRLAAAKVAGAKAPAAADAGPAGSGAVDWLFLTAKQPGSVGLAGVYRVNTAGGGPLRCDAPGQAFSVSYASQYWFYA